MTQTQRFCKNGHLLSEANTTKCDVCKHVAVLAKKERKRRNNGIISYDERMLRILYRKIHTSLSYEDFMAKINGNVK